MEALLNAIPQLIIQFINNTKQNVWTRDFAIFSLTGQIISFIWFFGRGLNAINKQRALKVAGATTNPAYQAIMTALEQILGGLYIFNIYCAQTKRDIFEDWTQIAPTWELNEWSSVGVIVLNGLAGLATGICVLTYLLVDPWPDVYLFSLALFFVAFRLLASSFMKPLFFLKIYLNDQKYKP